MKRIAARAVAGLCLGLSFAPFEVDVAKRILRVCRHTAVAEIVHVFYRILNSPAEFLGFVWFNVLQLPPRDEMAAILVPAAALLVQWGLIGLAAGLWWGFRSAAAGNEKGGRVWPILLAARRS